MPSSPANGSWVDQELRTRTHTHTFAHKPHTHTHRHAGAGTYRHRARCRRRAHGAYLDTYTCTQTCIRACLYACMHACMHAYMCGPPPPSRARAHAHAAQAHTRTLAGRHAGTQARGHAGTQARRHAGRRVECSFYYLQLCLCCALCCSRVPSCVAAPSFAASIWLQLKLLLDRPSEGRQLPFKKVAALDAYARGRSEGFGPWQVASSASSCRLLPAATCWGKNPGVETLHAWLWDLSVVLFLFLRLLIDECLGLSSDQSSSLFDSDLRFHHGFPFHAEATP